MTELWGALHRTENSGTVSFERHYNTDIEDLWECLTKPERLERWMAPVEIEGNKKYLIVFDADDPNQRSGGDILACEKPHKLELTWISPGESSPSHLAVELKEAGDGTDLSLEHSDLGLDSDVGYAAGWEVYLRQLTASLQDDSRPDFWGQWATFRDAYAATLKRG